jgi:hypothetical protein
MEAEMKFTTRDELTTKIREGAALSGLRMCAVREPPARAATTPADVEKVKAVLGDAAAAGRIVPGIWSTERRADDGHVIKVLPSAGGRGWVLDRFAKNPVVLWRHQTWAPRIGDAVAYIDTAGGQPMLRALMSFFPRDVNDLSWSLGEIAATRGYATSVSWDTLAAVPSPDDVRRNMPWACDILEAELLEGSLVNIGSDEDALAGGRADGIDVDPIARALTQAIDEARARKDKAVLERLLAVVKDPTVIVDLAAATPPPAITPAKAAEEVRAALGGQLLAP